MTTNKFHYFIISLLIFPLIFIGCGGGGGSAGGGGSGGEDDVLDLTQLGDADQSAILLELAQAEGTSPINLSYNIETVTPSIINPEPATILLIGSGLIGLGLGLRHRKNKK